MSARAQGWVDGLVGSERHWPAELQKFQQRGEEECRRAALWFARVAKDLDGECTALFTRIESLHSDEARLAEEVAELTRNHDRTGKFPDDARLKSRERDLDLARRQQHELQDRLDRARAQRVQAWEMAHESAQALKDYSEGVMYEYLAGNRKAPDVLDPPPEIEIPESLRSRPVDLWQLPTGGRATSKGTPSSESDEPKPGPAAPARDSQ